MKTNTEGLAIASLILACLSIILGPFGFVPGIICGHRARARIRDNPQLAGEGMALAGLIISYVFLFLMLLTIVIFFNVKPIPQH